jgi:hypothetical protein
MGAESNSFARTSNLKAKTLQEGDEHINQQRRNDPLEVTNATEKEWDQLDTRLAKYSQNNKRTSS